MTTDRAVEFVHTATTAERPNAVAEHVRVRTLDTLAAITAGFRVPGVDIVSDYVQRHCDGSAAVVLDGSGSRRSVAGATFANAIAANALDIDDGHREVKGHPAAAVVPPALAAAEATDATVGELLDAVYVGYEIAVRAGLAIHATDGVYTGTGSWGAVGAAAAVARLRGLTDEATAHALGTAEYHAPRTPIMRGVERPGMTKDGIGWGAYAGAVAVDLARNGFTGSGTVFDEPGVDVAETLWTTHHVTRGYLKPYPCCRWAHPGIDAVLELRNRHGVDPDTVEDVRIHTFTEATRLDTRRPATVEDAEYAYPYPVAAALVRGQFTVDELREPAREDESIRRLAETVRFVVDPELDERFPEACLARVELATSEGTYRSAVTRPSGARDQPLDAAERRRKVVTLCRPTLDTEAIDAVRARLSDRASSVASVLTPWLTSQES